jgi:hypothetical protein
MKHRLKLLCLLGVLLPAICTAQGDFRQGYIIKNDGDSISGFVDYRIGTRSSSKASFRATKKDSKTEYSPTEIRAYGFRPGKRFESIVLPQNGLQVFAEVLVKGPASLYTHNDQYYVKTTSLVWLKKPDKAYVEILNTLLTECSLRADGSRLKASVLVSLIQNYNRCKGGAGKVYKEAEQPSSKFGFYIFTGLNLTRLHASAVDENIFRKDRAVLLGGGLEVSFPELSNHVFLTIEANYANYKTHGYHEITEGFQTRRSDYFIEGSFVRIPIGIGYNVFKDTSTPYLKVGIVKPISSGSILNQYEDVEKTGIVTSSEKTFNLESSVKTGYWFGVGFSQRIRGPVKGFLELRFENMPGLTGHNVLEESKFTTTSLLLGLKL